MAMIEQWLLFVLQFVYGACAIGLATYSLHSAWLVYLAHRCKHIGTPPMPGTASLPGTLPQVTIQLPVYNERHVVDRLIDACARLDYPPDLVQIQVLDDSDDETVAMVDRRCEFWRRQGRTVEVVRRAGRSGFKAGALAHALPLATGKLVAIFDADFCPEPDFLRKLIPHFYTPGGARVGFVQARWGHLNRDYSVVTRSQALALDGHFAIEQDGRFQAGYFIGFNGSGGIWRRACIEDPAVGGWQQDTLCEDLDLSYRAQMAGWRPVYLNDVIAPAELPPQVSAYKRQQYRWAKGSMQTLKKLAVQVWHTDRPWVQRLSATIHLGNYLIHPMLLLLLLIIPPILLLGASPLSPVPLIGMTSFGPPLLYAAGQVRLDRRAWWKRWAYLPLLTLLGMGVCLNNTVAVWQGWRTQGGVFQRTPKFRVEKPGDRWRTSGYRLPVDRMLVGELFMMMYALFAAALIWQREGLLSAPFMLLYAASFAAVAGAGLWQSRPQRGPAGTQETTAPQGQAGAGNPLLGGPGLGSPVLNSPVPPGEVLVKSTVGQVE